VESVSRWVWLCAVEVGWKYETERKIGDVWMKIYKSKLEMGEQ